MTATPRSQFLPDFFSLGGVEVTQFENLGATLLANTTYFAEFGQFSQGVIGPIRIGIHFVFDSSIIANITWQGSNFPELSIFSPVATPGWDVESIPPAIVIPGGASGQNEMHWEGFASNRARAVVVVGATGGRLRFASTNKV
jgi:hypothetical protein